MFSFYRKDKKDRLAIFSLSCPETKDWQLQIKRRTYLVLLLPGELPIPVD